MRKSVKILTVLCMAVFVAALLCACSFAPSGLSAYEIAVRNGFRGTEKEWLESLVGDTTVNETVNNYTVTGDGQDVAVAANTGLKSVVSVFASFTVQTSNGSWHGFGQQTTTVTSAGAGIVYKTQNNAAYIITNYHVVYSADSILQDKISADINVYLYGMEGAEYAIPASYVGGSMYYDIAVLKVTNSNLIQNAVENNTVCAVQFANSEAIYAGQRAIAIGNPAAEGISVTSGIISVDSEYITMTAVDNKTSVTYRAIRTDTAINSGNSGGGLFDADGKLIGVVNAKMNTDTAENIGYAIPSNLAKSVADNIIYYCESTTNKTVIRPILGVTTTVGAMRTEINPETGMIDKYQTIVVDSVEEGGLAYGKVKAGDTVLSVTVGGVKTEITRLHHLAESLINARVGDKVVIELLRSGEAKSVEITITQGCLTAY